MASGDEALELTETKQSLSTLAKDLWSKLREVQQFIWSFRQACSSDFHRVVGWVLMKMRRRKHSYFGFPL